MSNFVVMLCDSIFLPLHCPEPIHLMYCAAVFVAYVWMSSLNNVDVDRNSKFRLESPACFLALISHYPDDRDGVSLRHVVCFWRNSPTRARAASRSRFLDHTQLHTTVCSSGVDGWSACYRDHYLTTLTTDKHPFLQRDSNPQSQQASVRRRSP